MSQNWQSDIKDLMKLYGQEIKSKPEIPDQKVVELRKKLCCEEFHEFMMGLGSNFNPSEIDEELIDFFNRDLLKVDLVELVDGAIDLMVVVIGTLLAFGVNPQEVWDEIHRSNMSKSVNGKLIYREDMKVLKPEGWSPPRIKELLLAQGMTE